MPTPAPDLLTQLGRDTLVLLWDELAMDDVFGSAKGRRAPTLAEAFVTRYETQLLSVKPIRDALLRYFADNYGVKKLRSDRGVNAHRKDWPTDLFPAWRAGGAWAWRLCRALDLDAAYAGLPSPEAAAGGGGGAGAGGTRAVARFPEGSGGSDRGLCAQWGRCEGDGDPADGRGQDPHGDERSLPAAGGARGRDPWIALTREVCEQAARAYKQVYQARPRDFEGLVHRLWGTYNLDPDFDAGFVVASAQKLAAMLEGDLGKRQRLKNLANATTLVVFDEAHHVIAPTYKRVLQYFSRRSGHDPVPVIGLTATPGRGPDPTREQVRRLARFFDDTLLVPDLLRRSRNPYARLQREGILSRTDDEHLTTDEVIDVTPREQERLETFHDYPAELRQRVGQMEERNRRIVQTVRRRHAQKPCPTLVFACDTTQAEILAVAWRQHGLQAKIILGETPPALRRRWIEDFAAGRIDILVSYGVLTTGFDAPNVERIVMARPTTSPVLFEQMIGRGLRGPKFGGRGSGCGGAVGGSGILFATIIRQSTLGTGSLLAAARLRTRPRPPKPTPAMCISIAAPLD